jgi:hypothetical protein
VVAFRLGASSPITVTGVRTVKDLLGYCFNAVIVGIDDDWTWTLPVRLLARCFAQTILGGFELK